jgi:hypothetical protein
MSQALKVVCIGALLFLTACSKHYVQVTRVDINKSSLASVFTGTPDSRKIFPPKGEQLLIEWNLPSTVKGKKLLLDLSLVYHDYTEETVRFSLDKARGMMSYFLLGERFQVKKGFLTYQAEIRTVEGELIKSCKEHLWVKLIQLEKEEVAKE